MKNQCLLVAMIFVAAHVVAQDLSSNIVSEAADDVGQRTSYFESLTYLIA
jgi:hypothetical protein